MSDTAKIFYPERLKEARENYERWCRERGEKPLAIPYSFRMMVGNWKLEPFDPPAPDNPWLIVLAQCYRVTVSYFFLPEAPKPGEACCGCKPNKLLLQDNHHDPEYTLENDPLHWEFIVISTGISIRVEIFGVLFPSVFCPACGNFLTVTGDRHA